MGQLMRRNPDQTAPLRGRGRPRYFGSEFPQPSRVSPPSKRTLGMSLFRSRRTLIRSLPGRSQSDVGQLAALAFQPPQGVSALVQGSCLESEASCELRNQGRSRTHRKSCNEACIARTRLRFRASFRDSNESVLFADPSLSC